MKVDLTPQQVAARLANLRALHVPESIDEATRRLAREQPRARESFETRAARALAELRALVELARYLHRG
jgi:hypothetical protein